MPVEPTPVRYGPEPSQFLERWEPGGTVARPDVLLLHGGWWRQKFDLHLNDRLAADLADRGHRVWNAEYRRIDGGDGGWPETLTDVLAACEAIAEAGTRPGSVVAVGHSAGGHLALLAAAGAGLAGAVALAPIVDPVACATEGLGEGATPLFFGGGPEAVPSAYAAGSPLDRLPLGVPQLVVHGTEDERVPVAHSRRYVERARALGDPVELREEVGGDHFFVLDPLHPYWAGTVDWIAQR